MRVDITGRHVDITPGLRQLIDKRSPRLERLLNDSAVSATVILTKEKYRHKTEIVVHAKGDHMLSGIGEGNTWPLSIRKAAAKIEHQAQKLKSQVDRTASASARTTAPSRAAALRRAADGPARRPRDPLRRQADVGRGRGASGSKRCRRRSSCFATPTPTPSASCTAARTAISD